MGADAVQRGEKARAVFDGEPDLGVRSAQAPAGSVTGLRAVILDLQIRRGEMGPRENSGDDGRIPQRQGTGRSFPRCSWRRSRFLQPRVFWLDGKTGRWLG